MSTTDAKTDDHSVITFYSFGDVDVAGLSFREIWDNFVIVKCEGLKCHNVVSVSTGPKNLAAILANICDDDDYLLPGIYSESVAGAVYMFIQPVIGTPIDGYMIKEYLKEIGYKPKL